MQTWGPLEQHAYDQYLAFMREHHTAVEPLGDWKTGETEIVSDRDQVEACIRAMRDRLATHRDITHDQLLSWTRIGVVYEDQYGFIVRYPVFFPPNRHKGETEPNPGMYITFYWRTLFGKTAATCAIPVMPNGRIALLKVYRHAIRAWTLEFPRGGAEAGMDVRDVLIRELREEAGIEVAEIVPLGEIEPDNGLLASRVPAYLVRVERVGEASKEYAETIEGLALFTPGEFDRLLDAQQYVEPCAGNVMRCYALRGSFEEVLFRRACRRGLITL